MAAPDGGYGWVVVAASFLVNMIADGVTFSFGVMFDEFQGEFGSTKVLLRVWQYKGTIQRLALQRYYTKFGSTKVLYKVWQYKGTLQSLAVQRYFT